VSALELFRGIVAAQKKGTAVGVCSICSAHPAVIDAAFRSGAAGQKPVLIESTVNQVNQAGGYAGMTPGDFRAFIQSRAGECGFPPDRIILGGDHLGPYPWRKRPAAVAMELARELVAACVSAGYEKIHLDASMPLGGDATSSFGGLDPAVAAQREAELAQAAEAAFQELARARPGISPPVYVVGTEVPAPGGITGGSRGVAVTRAAELNETVALCRESFQSHGLRGAWDRVIACVAQPGVEFGDGTIQRYDREKAAELCGAARAAPGLVIEGHSTDYQSPSTLRQLVEDGIAILKVGPALTFAMRECLFSLERMERELAPIRGFNGLSNLAETLDRAMRENPASWQDYYAGSDAEVRFSRVYSFSDRCRYSWTAPGVRQSVAVLFRNLAEKEMPLTLLSQHVPHLYPLIADGRLAAEPQALVRESICLVLEGYAAATGGA